MYKTRQRSVFVIMLSLVCILILQNATTVPTFKFKYTHTHARVHGHVHTLTHTHIHEYIARRYTKHMLKYADMCILIINSCTQRTHSCVSLRVYLNLNVYFGAFATMIKTSIRDNMLSKQGCMLLPFTHLHMDGHNTHGLLTTFLHWHLTFHPLSLSHTHTPSFSHSHTHSLAHSLTPTHIHAPLSQIPQIHHFTGPDRNRQPSGRDHRWNIPIFSWV